MVNKILDKHSWLVYAEMVGPNFWYFISLEAEVNG